MEPLRTHLREAFGSKDMADPNRQLGQELQTAKRELDDINRRLRMMLNAQLVRNRHEIDHCDVAPNVLDAVPVPMFGINDDGVLMFANATARVLCGHDSDLQGGLAPDHLPSNLRQPLHDDLTLVTLAKRQWWAMCRPLGGQARGRLLVLLPQTGGSDMTIPASPDAQHWKVSGHIGPLRVLIPSSGNIVVVQSSDSINEPLDLPDVRSQ